MQPHYPVQVNLKSLNTVSSSDNMRQQNQTKSKPAALNQRSQLEPRALTSHHVHQLQRMIGNRAVSQFIKSHTNPNAIQPAKSSSPTIQSNPSGQVIQRVAHSVINLSDTSVTAKEGAEDLSWDDFTEEYEDLKEAATAEATVIKLTDNQTTAIIYDSNDVIIQTLTKIDGEWTEQEGYEMDEVEYVLDRTVPDDPDGLILAKKLKDEMEEDISEANLKQLYKSVSDLPAIATALNNMGDAEPYDWTVLLTRLTQGLDRKIIAGVLEEGKNHFTIAALLNTMNTNPSTAVSRVKIAASWGDDDTYLRYAQSMSISTDSPISRILGTRLAAAVEVDADITWERPQEDVHYAGGNNQAAQPRTGFLQAELDDGTIIEIHAHWYRINGGKITSAHVQAGGANGLEINKWNHLSGLMTEIINRFNEPGANLPTGQDGNGTLTLT